MGKVSFWVGKIICWVGNVIFLQAMSFLGGQSHVFRSQGQFFRGHSHLFVGKLIFVGGQGRWARTWSYRSRAVKFRL